MSWSYCGLCGSVIWEIDWSPSPPISLTAVHVFSPYLQLQNRYCVKVQLNFSENVLTRCVHGWIVKKFAQHSRRIAAEALLELLCRYYRWFIFCFFYLFSLYCSLQTTHNCSNTGHFDPHYFIFTRLIEIYMCRPFWLLTLLVGLFSFYRLSPKWCLLYVLQ